jgi:hypothetical protein
MSLGTSQNDAISLPPPPHPSNKMPHTSINEFSLSASLPYFLKGHGRRDPLRWPRDTLYPQKLALTSPTCGGRSVGIVRLRTKGHGVKYNHLRTNNYCALVTKLVTVLQLPTLVCGRSVGLPALGILVGIYSYSENECLFTFPFVVLYW